MRGLGDGCDLVLTLCKYDLFVLSWARVQGVRQESISLWPLLNECGCDTMLVWLW